MHKWLVQGDIDVEPPSMMDMLRVGRSPLESSLRLAVLSADMEEFSKLQALLMPYYDNAPVDLETSPLCYEMAGLSLTYFLAQNKLKEFRQELEKLPMEVLTREKHVALAFKMEQYLFVGNYKKFINQDIPCSLLTLFTNRLKVTLQKEEIACIHASYDEMGVDDLHQKLHMCDAKASYDEMGVDDLHQKLHMCDAKAQ